MPTDEIRETKRAIEAQKYSKEALYESYCVEYTVRKKAEDELRLLGRVNADLRYKIDSLSVEWFNMYVKANLPFEDVQDPDEELELWHNHKDKRLLWTSNKGFIAVMEFDDLLWIQWMYSPPKHWRTEIREMPDIVRDLVQSTDKPIRYRTMDNKFFSKHSIKVSGNNEYEIVKGSL